MALEKSILFDVDERSGHSKIWKAHAHLKIPAILQTELIFIYPPSFDVFWYFGSFDRQVYQL